MAGLAGLTLITGMSNPVVMFVKQYELIYVSASLYGNFPGFNPNSFLRVLVIACIKVCSCI